MEPILIIIIVLASLWCSYLVVEMILVKVMRKKFKHIIYINGTRGKSTVTRLIGSALRENGFKVFTKVTGSRAVTIDANGVETKIVRHGNANIREQIKTMWWALKNNCDCLVLECMAVRTEYQRISQNMMLNSDIGIITNARLDHTEEMGESVYEIANALSNTIPTNGILVIPKELVNQYTPICKDRNTKIVSCFVDEQDDTIDFIRINKKLALSVCIELGISEENALKAMEHYKEDVGALKVYNREGTAFINGFAINDPDSIKKVYKKMLLAYPNEDITFLINNRSDRPIRALQHIDLLNELKPKKVYVVGAFKHSFKKRVNTNVEYVKNFDLLTDNIIFGIGNIKGPGSDILNYFEKAG